MLAVPLKKSKPLDWEGPLLEYIKTHYGGAQVASAYTSDARRLSNSRSRAAAVTSKEDSEALLNYVQLLNCVGGKFPSIRGGDGKLEWSKLQFSWGDAFRPKKTVAQTDAEYEKACVVFNLGAVESLYGIECDVTNPEGLKSACACFNKAAGVFAFLEVGMAVEENQPVHLKGALTSDLSPEGLAMLKNLMLAQAQACVYERAVLDAMKPAILSKLALQVSKFYELALKYARNPTLSKILDEGWAKHMEFHKRKSDAQAEYYMALVQGERAKKTAEGYGDEIAWLQRSEISAKFALDWASKSKLPSGVSASMQTFCNKIKTELTKALEDNSKIYFQSIPAANTLPAMEAHAVAKPTSVDERLVRGSTMGGEEPIFKNLLIPWMKDAEESYKTRMAGNVKSYGIRVVERTNLIRTGLAEAGLPAAIENQSDHPVGVPQPLWDRISNQVLIHGGTPRLYENAQDSRNSNTYLGNKLNSVEQDLKIEQDADTAARSRSHALANSTQPSKQLNSTMYNDLNQYRRLLSEAKASDDAVVERIRSAKTLLELLAMTREQMSGYLPDVKGAVESDPNADRVRRELSQLFVDLGVKVQECENAQTGFVEAASDCTLVPVLEKLDDGNSQKAAECVAKALQQFQPYMEAVESKLSSLSAKFEGVLQKNHEFSALRKQNDAMKKREKALLALDSAVNKYVEIASAVREGKRFYADLAAQIEQLNSVVQDFCFVRNVERDEAGGGGSRAATDDDAVEATAPVYNAPAPARPLRANLPVASVMPVSAPIAATGGVPVPPHIKQQIDQMKSFLNLESVPDRVLEPYVKASNGDINLAVDRYLNEHANDPAPSLPAGGGATSGSTKGGWFAR